MTTLAATDQKIYYEGVKQAKSGPFVLMECAKHCGSTWDELMETNGGSVFFFSPPLLLVSQLVPLRVWYCFWAENDSPFKPSRVFWSKNEKFFFFFFLPPSKSICNSPRFKNTVPVHCTVWCGINREMHLVHSRRAGRRIDNKQISRNCKRYRLFN